MEEDKRTMKRYKSNRIRRISRWCVREEGGRRVKVEERGEGRKLKGVMKRSRRIW